MPALRVVQCVLSLLVGTSVFGVIGTFGTEGETRRMCELRHQKGKQKCDIQAVLASFFPRYSQPGLQVGAERYVMVGSHASAAHLQADTPRRSHTFGAGTSRWWPESTGESPVILLCSLHWKRQRSGARVGVGGFR